MIYSQAFQQCHICNQGTFSLSGDIACTRCAPGHYAPENSAACFPNDKIGTIMRVDALLASFRIDDFIRELALVLQSETTDFNIIAARAGSVVVYYTVEDPVIDPNEDSGSDIRRLSGNEKSLLMYQWWVTNSDRLDNFDYDIIDFKLFARAVNPGPHNDGKTVVVEQLFVSTDDPLKPIIPDRPLVTNSGGQTIITGDYRQSTFDVSLTVKDSASSLTPTFALIFAILSSLFVLFF